jgi:hypothetical protein
MEFPKTLTRHTNRVIFLVDTFLKTSNCILRLTPALGVAQWTQEA